MTWGKVDDRLHSHSKARRAREAMALWVLALSWCCAELTDGFVPSDMPELLIPGGDAMADKLVSVGLWERTDDGFRFHDWHEFQPSAASVKQARDAAKDRMQRIRKGRSHDVRANTTRTNSEHNANEQRSSSEVRPKFALPVPVPEPISKNPPYPPPGDSGRDGTSDQPSEDERRADVEAVASVGRTIDPSLDRDAVDERRASERDPAEREPVDPMRRLAGQLVRALNEHSGGRVSLSMLSSAQLAALRAKLEELDASSDGVDVEDCAVLAVWAQFSDGLRWAKEPVGPAWLLKESNLASALSNALGWWRSRGHRDSAARSAHRAALRSLGVQTQDEPAPPPRAPSPPASEPFVPVSPKRVREILGRGRHALPQPPSSAEGPSVDGDAPAATVVRPVAEAAPTAPPTRKPRVSTAPTDPEERRRWNREQVALALEEERRAPAALASGDDHRGVR